jgi:hypothetical protein
VNTDDEHERGSHWVAFNFVNGTYEFFDSYGQSPSEYGFQGELLQWDMKYSKKVLQGFNSSVCGQYCLLFLLLRSRNYSYHKILSWFSDELSGEQRDHCVNNAMQFYLKEFTDLNISLKVHDKSFFAEYITMTPICYYEL